MNAGGEYPRCLHGANGATCLVTNDEARDAKLAEGWSLRPVVDAPATEPAPVAQPEPVDDAPKKRGRKKADTTH